MVQAEHGELGGGDRDNREYDVDVESLLLF